MRISVSTSEPDPQLLLLVLVLRPRPRNNVVNRSRTRDENEDEYKRVTSCVDYPAGAIIEEKDLSQWKAAEEVKSVRSSSCSSSK
jgi:hypothetical protein